MNIDLSFAKKLRPVELFYLICRADHEDWEDRIALAAVLSFLLNQGYVVQRMVEEEKKVFITDSGIKALSDSSLRSYEKSILTAIKDDNLTEVMSLIDNLESDLKEQLVTSGLLVEGSRPFLFFFTRRVTIMSLAAEAIVKQLCRLRDELTLEIKNKREINQDYILFLPIFPSLMEKDEFSQYSDQFSASNILALMMFCDAWSVDVFDVYSDVGSDNSSDGDCSDGGAGGD
jgi:hypothetical protein